VDGDRDAECRRQTLLPARFIVPHDIERVRGEDSARVPVELAEVYDTGPDRGYVLPV
jgi:hypothetical protein